MYTIDLATLLQMLKEFSRSGILSASLPIGTGGIREPALAQIELVRGDVTQSSIINAKGQILKSGPEALRILMSTGVLEWKLQKPQQASATYNSDSHSFQNQLPSSPQHSSSPERQGFSPSPYNQPARSDTSPVPQRRIHIDQQTFNSWPRLHRHIYMLIDGRTSAQTIAIKLSLYPHGIEQVKSALRDLEAYGFIIGGT